MYLNVLCRVEEYYCEGLANDPEANFCVHPKLQDLKDYHMVNSTQLDCVLMTSVLAYCSGHVYIWQKSFEHISISLNLRNEAASII